MNGDLALPRPSPGEGMDEKTRNEGDGVLELLGTTFEEKKCGK